jgi:hypothetical protein
LCAFAAAAISLRLASIGAAQQAAPVVLFDPVIVTDQNGSGNAIIQIRNSGTMPLPVSLTTGDIRSKTTGRKVNAQIVFSKATESTGVNPSIEENVPPGMVFLMRATVSGLLEAGEFETSLIYKGEAIKSLRISRRQFPLAITIDGLNPGSPDVFFQDGKPTTLTLKNNDALTYPFRWDLTVDGVTLSSGAVGILAPGGASDITFQPADEWFSIISGLFKDDVAKGRLRLRFVPVGETPSVSDPSKDIPLNVHLSYWSPLITRFIAGAITLLLLLLGGISSMVLNLSLPNQLRRLNIKDSLKTLGPKIADIPIQIDSRARVMLGIERKRLADFIKSRKWYSAEFGAFMDIAAQSITKLSTRIDLLQRLNLTLSSFYRNRNRIPPRIVDEIEETRARAMEILQKRESQDPELQTVQTCIAEIQKRIDAMNQPDAALAKNLADEVVAMQQDFDPAKGRIGTTATCADVLNDLPGPFNSLAAAPTDPAKINPVDYGDIDRMLFKLRLIREFVELREGRANSEFRLNLDHYGGEFLEYLSFENLDSLFAARDLLGQMQANTFESDVEEELKVTPPQLSIEADRGEIRAYEPIKLYASFYKKVLNSAPVRRGWICSWDFGDGLREKGWSVSHYFTEEQTYNVTVSFQHPEGHFIKNDDGNPIEVTQQFQVKPVLAERLGARAGLEAVRLGVALFAAVVALMAGAQDQLMKLDIFAGLVAVFLLGFGADTVKNLLTQKT